MNGDPRHSDHRPVIVDTHGGVCLKKSSARSSIPRFEARWLEEEDCRGIVENTWERGVEVEGKGVMGAVKGVLGELVDWSRNILGDLEKRISKLKKELEAWRRKNISAEQVHKEEILRFNLSRLEDQKELYWKQRAHVSWLRNGDRNTKFFHTFTSERKKMNRIMKLKREDGGVVEEEEAMKEVATNYFSKLFTSSTGSRMDELLGYIQPRVTDAMNGMLCKEFTSEEVVEALESIGDLKAPGIDGMHSLFYKKFWDVVGEKVTEEVLQVLNGGPMPPGWNETCIVLIPKVTDPDSMKDLRPISLCNVVYKIISKILVNRLKQILEEIISPNQSAFVPGRLITDNILLAYECTHFMKGKKSGKDGYAAVKLDMSKAYDRVEWAFMEQIRYWARESMQISRGEKNEATVQHAVQWQKPEGDLIKINTDGAFDAATRHGGWVLSRATHRGQFEALGLAMSDMHVLPYIRRRWLASKLYKLLPIGEWVVFAPRSCNKLAHELAAYGSAQTAERALWMDMVPDDVSCCEASLFAEPN
ncbi:uncharacterized protein [Lolium perenne]|uniref:uncharacterized protein n=1 Tax=Lolium perenne TaxID=4522 RepID=UPI003A99D717